MILPEALRAAHRKMSDDFIGTLYKVTRKITKGLDDKETLSLEISALESSIASVACSAIATVSQSEDPHEISKVAIKLLRNIADSMEEQGILGQKVIRGGILEEDDERL